MQNYKSSLVNFVTPPFIVHSLRDKLFARERFLKPSHNTRDFKNCLPNCQPIIINSRLICVSVADECLSRNKRSLLISQLPETPGVQVFNKTKQIGG